MTRKIGVEKVMAPMVNIARLELINSILKVRAITGRCRRRYVRRVLEKEMHIIPEEILYLRYRPLLILHQLLKVTNFNSGPTELRSHRAPCLIRFKPVCWIHNTKFTPATEFDSAGRVLDSSRLGKSSRALEAA
jgi:hypothetical protein